MCVTSMHVRPHAGTHVTWTCCFALQGMSILHPYIIWNKFTVLLLGDSNLHISVYVCHTLPWVCTLGPTRAHTWHEHVVSRFKACPYCIHRSSETSFQCFYLEIVTFIFVCMCATSMSFGPHAHTWHEHVVSRFKACAYCIHISSETCFQCFYLEILTFIVLCMCATHLVALQLELTSGARVGTHISIILISVKVFVYILHLHSMFAMLSVCLVRISNMNILRVCLGGTVVGALLICTCGYLHEHNIHFFSCIRAYSAYT
jgi:hypothetical protein